MKENENLKRCPWCRNELEEGIFRSRGGNYFQPINESAPWLYTKKLADKHKGIMLKPDPTSPTVEFPKAYTCRNCKRIIIPY